MMVKDKHKRMTVDFLEGLLIGQELKEGRGNNRSVMPLDALGRTRATMELLESILSFTPYLLGYV